MKYMIFGPYEIPLGLGKIKTSINKEDIAEFWSTVDPGINHACGIYIFSIKTKVKKNHGMLGKHRNKVLRKSVLHPIRLSATMKRWQKARELR